MYGNVCFEKSMKNTPSEWTCDCPMECNTISYSFSVVMTSLDPEELCPNYNDFDDFLMKPFYDTDLPPQFERKLMFIKENISIDAVDDCKRNLQYRAEVIFKLVTDTLSVTVISRRLSFFDKMSAFGKHLYISLISQAHYLMIL